MSGAVRQRLNQLDALRGLAAMAVVLFHFSTRFSELYPRAAPQAWSLPLGYVGVNLFFIISGFVIFMTVERTARPADFVVSRISRLYPAYWVAIILTFCITHALSLPGKTVSLTTALANGLMFHGFFRVGHVDGVYWTLEVELLFYALILVLFIGGRLAKVHWVLLGLIALRLTYHFAAVWWGQDWSWTVFRLLNLRNIAWFALGICCYQWVQPSSERKHAALAPYTASAALLSLVLTESALAGLLGLAFGLAVLAAAQGQLRWLEARPFVWLGAISYPLYLLHENIGWAVMLKLQELNWTAGWACAAALTLVLALSGAISRWVERPAMRWIRALYRQRTGALQVSST